MRLRTALTKKDIIIALVCLIFLVINVGAISSGGRRRAKRAVCLTNLRQLTLAWTDYAVDNDGKLVNGDTGEYSYLHTNETPWVLKDWSTIGSIPLTEKEQAIRDGALFPYCKDIKLYKCPLCIRRETRTYSVFDAMNCKDWKFGDVYCAMLKTITAILNPSERGVFIDDGGTGRIVMGGWSQYSIYYYTRKWIWWEPPPIRHDDGTTLSFADGHAEYWKWKDQRTLEWGKFMEPFSPPQPGNPDITRSQIASWGD